MAYYPLLLLLITSCWSAPIDEPVKVDLPVYDQPEPKITIDADAESSNAGRSNGQSLVGNLISHKLGAANSVLDNQLSFNHDPKVENVGFSGSVIGVFSPPVTSKEGALLETEGYGSKTLSIKENIQHMVAGVFQPKPIVDTIIEEEKYGNTGDKFAGAGRAIVGGAKSVSNLVNTLLEVPGTLFRKFTRVASEKLNNFGGRIIGLN